MALDAYYDDFDDDEADRALREQMDDDGETVWKVEIHELTHAMRERPLPGTFSDDWRRTFRGGFPALPAQPTVDELRNLFDDDSYENAKESARSGDADVRWFGAKFLYWRNEALGRFCFNVNCLRPLTQEGPRRGRPRFYCAPRVDESGQRVDCKNSALKRRKYHEAHPNAGQRLRSMLVPGIPFTQPRPYSQSSSGFVAPFSDVTAPWREDDDADDDYGEPRE